MNKRGHAGDDRDITSEFGIPTRAEDDEDDAPYGTDTKGSGQSTAHKNPLPKPDATPLFTTALLGAYAIEAPFVLARPQQKP